MPILSDEFSEGLRGKKIVTKSSQKNDSQPIVFFRFCDFSCVSRRSFYLQGF